MKPRYLIIGLGLIMLFMGINNTYSQSYKYAHYVLDSLISKDFAGRGYQNNGDRKAANFIQNELIKNGAKPIGNNSFRQELNIKINNIKDAKLKLHSKDSSYLKLGEEFLVFGSSPSADLVIENQKTILVDFNNKKLKSGLHNYRDKLVLFDLETTDIAKISSFIRLLNERNINPKLVIIQNCGKMQYFMGRSVYKFPIVQLKDKEIKKKINYLELSIKTQWEEDYTTQNLWAIIEGTTHKDSFFVFTSHYDHLGRVGEDCYFPGANDNASSVAALLDLVKYYSINPSEYSIVFIFTTGEEIGLLGAKYAANYPFIDLNKVKFLFNLDMCGTGSGGIALINGKKEKEASQIMQDINNEKRYFNEIRVGGESCNSDHCPFVQKGVAAFFIFTFGCEYNEYHTIFDNGKGLSFTKHLDLCNIIKDFIGIYKK